MDFQIQLNQLKPNPGSRSTFISKKKFKVSKKQISPVFPILSNETKAERSSLPKIVKGIHNSRYFNYITKTESDLEEPSKEIENLKKKLLKKDLEIMELKNLFLDSSKDFKREKSLNNLDRINSPKKEFKLGVLGKMVSHNQLPRNLSTPTRTEALPKNSYHSQYLLQKHNKGKLKILINLPAKI